MDFNLMNSLMIVEEKDSFDWALLGDPPPDVPLLSEKDALAPYRESLNQNNGLHGSYPLISDNLAALVPYRHRSPPPFDKLGWDDNDKLTPRYVDAISDVAPPNIITRSNDDVYDGKNDYSDLSEVFRVGYAEDRGTERSTNGRPRSTDVGFDEIKNYFCMPIARAAKEMNVGLTLLKKRCRELGIPRWPHRKMKSLRSLIHNVQELGNGASGESIRRELETLEEHRRLMEENPQIELTERTKKLRQACFKANFKRKRALQKSCFDLRNKYYA